MQATSRSARPSRCPPSVPPLLQHPPAPPEQGPMHSTPLQARKVQPHTMGLGSTIQSISRAPAILPQNLMVPHQQLAHCIPISQQGCDVLTLTSAQVCFMPRNARLACSPQWQAHAWATASGPHQPKSGIRSQQTRFLIWIKLHAEDPSYQKCLDAASKL